MEIRSNAKGQIVIPSILLRKYGVKNSTRIIILDKDDSIILKPMTEQYLKKLQGSLKGKGALKMLMNDKRIDSR
jgi:bifunctional DNA-binding transcriptional regulator/antitoxin component of YhaV-PrlF toxin-antitoxin module